MEKAKNPMLEPNKIIAVVGYVFFTLFGGSIFVIILAFAYNKFQGLNLTSYELLEIIGESDFTKINGAYQRLYVISNALGNMLTYLFMLVIVVFFMRNFILEDTDSLKKNQKLYWMIPVFAVVGYGLTLLVDTGISYLVRNTSVNQSSIEGLILHGGSIPMFIAVVICAPIVEELIYRKAIYEFLKKRHIAIFYIVSIVLFALPHMITTFISMDYTFFDNVLMSIPYLFSGFLLCLTFHLCDKNIYASWFMHMINNLLAFLIIVASLGL